MKNAKTEFDFFSDEDEPKAEDQFKKFEDAVAMYEKYREIQQKIAEGEFKSTDLMGLVGSDPNIINYAEDQAELYRYAGEMAARSWNEGYESVMQELSHGLIEEMMEAYDTDSIEDTFSAMREEMAEAASVGDVERYDMIADQLLLMQDYAKEAKNAADALTGGKKAANEFNKEALKLNVSKMEKSGEVIEGTAEALEAFEKGGKDAIMAENKLFNQANSLRKAYAAFDVVQTKT